MTRTDASSSIRILAKPDETLEEHTLKATQWLLNYLQWREGRLTKIAEATGIELKELKSRLFATCYLHDIGKTSRSFQAYDFGRGNQGRGIPHPLLSLPFIYAALPHPIKIGANTIWFEALTVMSHHTPYYDNLYRAGYRDIIIKEEHYHLEEALKFYNNLPEAHEKTLGFEFPYELTPPSFGEAASILLDRAGDFYRVPPQIRPVFSFYVATLKYADWLASGNDPTYQYHTADMAERLLGNLKKKHGIFKDLFRFQQEAWKGQGHIVINAPTGQGKTEAALLWADSNRLNGRAVYLLPARVSTNAMYERLKEAFASGVGISHGTSALTIAEEEAWDEKAYKTRILRSSTFMEPITVATVDQLLLSIFNWRYWELIEEAASDSAIIFDEIHAYDPYTASLIILAARELEARGAKLAFMTATLPSYLRNFLLSALGVKLLVSDQEHYDLKRHLVQFTSKPIHATISNIIEDFRSGKRVLTVLNTVEEAISVYQAIKKQLKRGEAKRIILYHSRFIEMHRREKEKLIEEGAESDKGFIAVTTQVVEVSLDIDYDVLYTQLATVDALIQRMGRVNRKGKKTIGDNGNIFVSQPGEHDAFVYGQKNLDRASKIVSTFMTGRVLDEGEVPSLIERQYPPKKTRAELIKELKYLGEVLKELRQNLWHIQTIQLKDSENVLRRLAKTRKERFPTVEAIPLCFKDSVIDRLPSSHRLEKVRYYVRLPLYKFGDSLMPLEDILYASVKYDEELGATEPIPPETIL